MQITIMAVLLLAASAGQPKVLGTYPANELTAAQPEKDVEVVVDKSVTTDGGGSVKVTFTGSGEKEVMLFAQSLSGIDNAALWYESDMRCSAPPGSAYAAMWVSFPDGGKYFSRGLDQRCTQEWTRSRIPFYLKKGERPERVVMGVRFEGPGTVWVDNARLVKTGATKAMVLGSGIYGAVFGVLAGIWGALAGTLAPRGKGKWLVVGWGVSLCIIEVVLLGVGLGFLVAGQPQAIWSPMVVTGALGGALMGALTLLVLKRYRDYEAQRLAAQDAADSL